MGERAQWVTAPPARRRPEKWDSSGAETRRGTLLGRPALTVTEATLLISKMEIVMPALPSGRAIMDILSDKGQEIHLRSSEEVGRHYSQKTFPYASLKDSIPLTTFMG